MLPVLNLDLPSILDCIVIFGGGSPVGDFGSPTVQIASSSTLGLNNTSDSLTLRDSYDLIIDAHSYGFNAGDNQSITRDPDNTGPDPMVQHSQANGYGGALFSPGTLIDGSPFVRCALSTGLKHHSRNHDQ